MTPSNDDPRPESPTPSDPCSIVDSLLSEAESRRQQESEARRIAAERARRLNEQKALRDRLEHVFDRAYTFPKEEREQGRKPCPEGLRRWAERFLTLGTVLRECGEAIDGLRLVERLRAVAERSAPAAMKYACALLLLASEGQADAVAPALDKANSDGELRRFVLWLPFILDNLWHPFPDERGSNPVATPPDGTTREEMEQADQAFGWRPLFPSEEQERSEQSGTLQSSQIDGRPDSLATGELVLPTVRYGVDEPTPPGIPDPLWQLLQELRHYVAALDRFAYQENPDGSRSFRAIGRAGVLPVPHNYGGVVAKLVEMCLDVKRGLKAAVPTLSLPDPPPMPPDLCDLKLSFSDPRRWLAFKSAIEKLKEWVNQCRTAVTPPHPPRRQERRPAPAGR